MIRTRTFAAAALAASAFLAACGGSPRPAAVVDGIEISQQEVVDELEAIEGNTTYLEAYEEAAAQQGDPAQGARPLIRGDEEGTFNTAFVATTLQTRIVYALLEAELDRRGVTPDPECREAAHSLVVQQFASYSPEGDGEAVLAGFGEEYANYLVDRNTDFLVLQATLADQPCVLEGTDAVEAYYEANPEQFAVETACVSHILVETQAEADEIAGLLAGGGDFATLAAERSIDTGSGAAGGELGCAPAGQYVPEFDAAAFSQEVGVVGPVVPTEFGFHLILVTERGVPEFAEVEDQVAEALAQEVETVFFEWFEARLAEADVTVDPRYGTWNPARAVIDRPVDAGTSVPAADE